MSKKLFFLTLIMSFSVNFNYVLAETGLIIPLKKPSLSDNEIKDRILSTIPKRRTRSNSTDASGKKISSIETRKCAPTLCTSTQSIPNSNSALSTLWYNN